MRYEHHKTMSVESGSFLWNASAGAHQKGEWVWTGFSGPRSWIRDRRHAALQRWPTTATEIALCSLEAAFSFLSDRTITPPRCRARIPGNSMAKSGCNWRTWGHRLGPKSVCDTIRVVSELFYMLELVRKDRTGYLGMGRFSVDPSSR